MRSLRNTPKKIAAFFQNHRSTMPRECRHINELINSAAAELPGLPAMIAPLKAPIGDSGDDIWMDICLIERLHHPAFEGTQRTPTLQD